MIISRTVYVSDISCLAAEQIKASFQRFGTVRDVQISGKAALITFATLEEGMRAIAAGEIVAGDARREALVRVEKRRPSAENIAFLWRIIDGTSAEELVHAARVATGLDPIFLSMPANSGIAFIGFETPEDATLAISRLEGFRLSGKALGAKPARQRREPPGPDRTLRPELWEPATGERGHRVHAAPK